MASAKEDCSGGAASRQGVMACLPGGRAWVPHGVKCLKLYPSFPPFTESSPSVSLLILLPMNCVCDASLVASSYGRKCDFLDLMVWEEIEVMGESCSLKSGLLN